MGIFKISRCSIVPKIVQIGVILLKAWAYECSGLAWYCKWKAELLMLGGATGVISLFNIELTNVLRTKQCWSVPTITQIGSDDWRFKDIQSNVVAYFWLTLYIPRPIAHRAVHKLDVHCDQQATIVDLPLITLGDDATCHGKVFLGRV